MQIGDVIARYRKLKKVESKDMAGELGITPNYLSLIETNKKKPKSTLLSEIADYLNLPVSALLFEVLQEKDFVNQEDRESFVQAKPLIDKMIQLLIADSAIEKKPDSDKSESKESVSNGDEGKHKSSKRTALN